MVFYYKQLIKHYWSATLIDVLHSPFVFALYNDCIKKNSNVKLLGFVPQSVGYINQRIEIILVKFKAQHPKHVYATHSKHVEAKVPFIFIHAAGITLEELQQIVHLAHNDSVIVLKQMYDSPESAANWEQVKKLDGVTASVDLFFVGYIFVRKEQRKQEFRLRLF